MLWRACFAVAVATFLVGVAAAADVRVTCRDEEGVAVDWYYIYKLPKHYSHHSERDQSGLLYMYLTSRQPQSWQLSSRHINASDSMPAQTLQPLFDDDTLLLVAYNDEFPNGTVTFTDGHTKGVVATDGLTGVWLIHSVPKYPSIPRYEYPRTGALYAQSFLCLSLPADEMHKVGEQLVYNEPSVYYTRLPVMLNGQFPELERAVQQQWRTEAPYHNLVQLQTLAGRSFKSYAKGRRYGKELYEDWLAPTLDANLLVESWRNGPGDLPSNCSSSDKVYNIAEIEAPRLQLSFKTTSDHSKWAVSQPNSVKLWRWSVGGPEWICVGDINRQAHQLQRGGGTVCQDSSQVAQLFRYLIKDFEACAPAQPKKSPSFLFWN